MSDDAPNDLRRPYLRELQALEVSLVRLCADEPSWLASHDEAALRWALSLARLSRVYNDEDDWVDIGRASDAYRTTLHEVLAPCFDHGKVLREGTRNQIGRIRTLVRDERDQLLRFFGDRLSAKALDRATRRRPLALAMSGGGGSAYVFVGMMAALEEAGLIPSVVSASSMGAIIGAFRCRTKNFEIKNLKALMTRITWKRVFRLFETQSRFGMPATLKLYLREVIGSEFLVDGEFLRLKDLAIPLRVTVAGIGKNETDPERYAHLLDDAVEAPRAARRGSRQIRRALMEVMKLPLKPIYLGGDDLTSEFDVLDAVGFSSAVPGVIHYDILRDDPRMVKLCEDLLAREGVYRLIDGGVADNLPAREAWHAVQHGNLTERDPFVLACDSFAPQLGRHGLFLPLMRVAAENSKAGRRVAHVTVTFKKILSPATVVPSQSEFVRAIQLGEQQINPHIGMIRKMVGPIPDPPGVLSERDGT